MNEDFLIYLWANQLFKADATTTGETLSVLDPGLHNHDSGPDFFNARIKIGDTTWAGNVEVHLRSSDWFRHGHQHDPAYESIILHVVFEDDKPIVRKNRQTVPALVLKGKFDERIFNRYREFIRSTKWIACQDSIAGIGHFEQMAWFSVLMAERLEEKAQNVQHELDASANDFNEVFYRKLAGNFGFKANADAFEALAASLPLRLLAKHNNDLLQIEALLFGQAGFLSTTLSGDYPEQLTKEYLFLSKKYGLKPLSRSRWKFLRMHPANFPTIRISQFANIIYRSSGLLHKMLESEKLTDVVALFKTQASSYWTTHYRFGQESNPKIKALGRASVNLLLINTVIPFIFVYGRRTASDALTEKALNWLEGIKAENNNITRHFAELGVKAQSAMQSQALLQLKKKYCNEKRCLACRFGFLLLKKEAPD